MEEQNPHVVGKEREERRLRSERRYYIIVFIVVMAVLLPLFVWHVNFYISDEGRDTALQLIEIADKVIDGEILARDTIELLPTDRTRAETSRRGVELEREFISFVRELWLLDGIERYYYEHEGVYPYVKSAEVLEGLLYHRNEIARIVGEEHR